MTRTSIGVVLRAWVDHEGETGEYTAFAASHYREKLEAWAAADEQFIYGLIENGNLVGVTGAKYKYQWINLLR